MNRRGFLKTSTSIAISASMFLTGCQELEELIEEIKDEEKEKSKGSPDNPNSSSKEKVLVYFMLGGGNDSYNMLVPTSTAAYNEYSTTRSNLAIAKADLLALSGFSDANSKTFGVHPAMAKVQTLFNNKKLSFVANVGPLVQRTTKAQFSSNSVPLPLGLMSHADQIKHWQTIHPDNRTNVGLFGKFADTFQKDKPNEQISMGISLSGTNVLQNGTKSKEYSITKDGSIGLMVKEPSANAGITALNNALLGGFNSILNKSYSDSFEDTYMATTRYAQGHHEKFKAEIKNISISHTFTNYDSRTDIKFTADDKAIPEQFKMVAKAIKASDSLNLPKQTFFVHYYGWDHHDELLNNHKRMLEVVSNALGDFQAAIEELGVDDKVITVVGSDFGRSLTSNGNGTDHAWGGNAIVMGKDIDGGKVFGTYPSLALNSSLDVGGGVLIPTLSIDELFAELALWYGVEKSKLADYIPNITNFYALNSANNPIGFIKG
jgi:uncharacterized protein (DUF1501 family)